MRSSAPGERVSKGRSSQLRPQSWRAPVPGAGSHHAATSDTEEAATADTSSEAAPEVMLAFSDGATTNQLSCQAMGAQRRRWIRELSRAAEGLVTAARAAAVLGGLQDPGIRAAILPQINRVEAEVNSKDLVWEQ